jgi:hypothetical protein
LKRWLPARKFTAVYGLNQIGRFERFERIKKKVLTYHRYIVIPISGGFYRIEYAAEEGVFSSYLPIFEAALASFKLSELAEVK